MELWITFISKIYDFGKMNILAVSLKGDYDVKM